MVNVKKQQVLDLGKGHTLTKSISNNSLEGLKACAKRKVRRLMRSKKESNTNSNGKKKKKTRPKSAIGTRNKTKKRTVKNKNIKTSTTKNSKSTRPVSAGTRRQRTIKNTITSSIPLAPSTATSSFQLDGIESNIWDSHILPPPINIGLEHEPQSHQPPSSSFSSFSSSSSSYNQKISNIKSKTKKKNKRKQQQQTRRPLRNVANARDAREEEDTIYNYNAMNETMHQANYNEATLKNESFLGDRSSFSQRAPKIPNILRPSTILGCVNELDEEDDFNNNNIDVHNSTDIHNTDLYSYNTNYNQLEPPPPPVPSRTTTTTIGMQIIQDKKQPSNTTTVTNKTVSTKPRVTTSGTTKSMSFASRQHKAKERQSKRTKKTKLQELRKLKKYIQTETNNNSNNTNNTNNTTTNTNNTNNTTTTNATTTTTTTITTTTSSSHSHRRMVAWSRQYDGAVRIQKRYRGNRIRSSLTFILPSLRVTRNRRRAATQMQRCVRGHSSRLDLENNHIAATVIQQTWMQRVFLFRHHHASVLIQATYRTHREQRTYLRYTNIIKIQKQWNRSQNRKFIRTTCQSYRTAAITIQKVLSRGISARHQHQQNIAATCLVMWYRRSLIQINCLERKMKKIRKTAATKIQLSMRWWGTVVRMKQRAVQVSRQRSAVALQKLIRGRSARFITQRIVQNMCAISIQTIIRSKLARQKVFVLRNLFEKSKKKYNSIVLQAWIRSMQQQQIYVTRLALKRHQDQEQVVVLLQKLIRGRAGRIQYQRCKQKRDAVVAVVFLQRVQRGCRARTKLQVLHTAANVIEQLWRSNVAIQKVQARRQEIVRTTSSIRIQTVSRRWLAIRSVSTLMNALIQLQNFGRTIVAKLKMNRRKNEEGFNGFDDFEMEEMAHVVDGKVNETKNDRDRDVDGIENEWIENDRNGRSYTSTTSKRMMRPPRGVVLDPLSIFHSFSNQGLALSSKVLAAVQKAEEVAARVEHELMGMHMNEEDAQLTHGDSELTRQLRMQNERSKVWLAAFSSP